MADIKDSPISVEAALDVIARKAGASAAREKLPALVCRACGKLLRDREGAPANATEDKTPCCAAHAALIDLNTARVNADRRVIAAVYLE